MFFEKGYNFKKGKIMKTIRKLFIGKTGSGAKSNCLKEAKEVQRANNNIEVILFSREAKAMEMFNSKNTILINENTNKDNEILLKTMFDINTPSKSRDSRLLVFDNIEWLFGGMNNIYEYYQKAKTYGYSIFVSIQNIENLIEDGDKIYSKIYRETRELDKMMIFDDTSDITTSSFISKQ